MDIKRIALIEKENRSFIRYSLAPEETIAKIELEMLKNNQIQGILDISEIQDDNGIVFLYNVTSKIQLLQRFTMPFSGEQVFKMLQSLCKLWICTDEYMLDRKHFMTYPELMCIDPNTSELYVMVLPVYAENDKEMEFRRIVIGILERISYEDVTMPNFLLLLMEYIRDHISLTARAFLEMLEKTYQTERGVLQPISEAPDSPEYKMEDRKEIVHEEAAKEILRSRFQAQNDEVKLLNHSFKEENGKNSFASPMGVPLQTKEKKIEKTVPFGIPSIPVQEKKKEKKPKKEKEKKIKEKKVKEKKNKKSETVPTVVQSIPEKEEKQVKEKKGWFRGFGFGKKKEVMEEKPQETPKVLIPVTEINERRVSPSGENESIVEQEKIENKIPIGKDKNVWQGMQGNLNNSQEMYPAWSLHSEMEESVRVQSQKQESWEQNFEKPKIQKQFKIEKPILIEKPTEIQKAIQREKQQKIPFQQIQSVNRNPMSLDLSEQEEMDLDATMLLDGSMDLDATVLINQEEKKEVFIPVLRSRETGEIIKITHNGFLVGRQKMRNGKVISLPGVRQPDLILPINNISHSHAEFIQKDEEWYLLDHASLNGTYINEEKLVPQQEQILQEGDILRFASEEYEYLIMTE